MGEPFTLPVFGLHADKLFLAVQKNLLLSLSHFAVHSHKLVPKLGQNCLGFRASNMKLNPSLQSTKLAGEGG